jgi:hypothetical protein
MQPSGPIEPIALPAAERLSHQVSDARDRHFSGPNGASAPRLPQSAAISQAARHGRGGKFPADCFFCQCLGMTQPVPVRIDCLKAIHRAQFVHKSGPGTVPRGETSMRGTGKPSLTMGLALASSLLILAPAAAVAQTINIPLPFIGAPHFGPSYHSYRAPAPSHRSSSGSSSHDSSSSSSSPTQEKDATQEEAASNGGSHQTSSPNTTRSQTSEAAPSSSSANHNANDAPAFAPSR